MLRPLPPIWMTSLLLAGTACAAPPSVTLLSSPAPFAVTSSAVQAGGQLTVVEGGTFDVLVDPGRCGTSNYTVSLSRRDLNWPPGLVLQVRAEGLVGDGNCKTPPPAVNPWATYAAVPTAGSLNALVVGGPLRATLRYRLDFTPMSNPLAVAPGVYTTVVTYTVTAP